MYRILAFSLLAFCLRPLTSFGQTYEADIRPILRRLCHDCHTGDDPAGEVDFGQFGTLSSVMKGFEVWEKVNQVLVEHNMPPEDEVQPSATERTKVLDWYRHTFVDSVKAKPGAFRPRRLAAVEYRNTLRSLFGFDLEVSVMQAEQTIAEKSLVMKLLPTDPPGASGFTNDTHRNPLTTQIWEQYSYLADFALEQLFSPSQRGTLESLAGKMGATGFEQVNAHKLVHRLLPRIVRRELDEAAMNDVMRRIESANDKTEATKLEIKLALMRPQFLYRGLLMPRTPGQEQDVDSFELAERLSYFLWADMPDDELFELARSGKLSDKRVLRQQVDRMLDSFKAVTLATDFATQWLHLHEIDHVSDNPPMMVAYKSQPIDFFQYLLAEDRPLMELIDSKVAFVNPLTKKFYGSDASRLAKYRKAKGIEVEIVPNSPLEIREASWRGGILTMPGVLAMNRGPILRGVWLVERIMGEHLPDPPADVGQVEGNLPGQNLSFRERFAHHRENESCAICHDKIDPLGFALEAYDDRGAYRLRMKSVLKPAKKNKKNTKNAARVDPIDTRGRLPTGEEFANFVELKHILMTSQREPIVRNIVKKMLAYALGRKLEIYDQPTVETIVSAMLESNGTWRDLVHQIVNSLPFRRTSIPAEKLVQVERLGI